MPERSHLQRLARGGMASLVGAVLSAVCGVALVVMITRNFDKSDAGIFFAGTSLFTILLAVVELGTDAGLTRIIPQKLVLGLKGDVAAVLRAALLPVLTCALVVSVLLWCFADAISELIGASSNSSDVAQLIRYLAVFIPFAAAYDTAVAATRGFGSMRPTVIVENIGRVLVQVSAIACVVAAGASLTVVALAWGFPYVLGLVAAVWWLRTMTIRKGVTLTIKDASGGVRGEFWRFTAPRSFAQISQIALKRADIVLVAALASPAEAAVYTAATRFMVVGLLGVRAIQQVLAPQLSRLFAEGNSRNAHEVVHLSTTWSVMLAWPIYIGCAILAPVVLSVFGHGYSSGEAVVVVLALAMLVGVGTGPVDVVLLMSGRSWLSLWNSLVAVVLDLGLDTVLIPHFGILGAAVAWSVAIVVSNLLATVQVRRHVSMLPGNIETIRVGAAAIVCFGVAPGVALVRGAPLAVTAALMAIGACVYGALLWRWRKPLALDILIGSMQRRVRHSVPSV